MSVYAHYRTIARPVCGQVLLFLMQRNPTEPPGAAASATAGTAATAAAERAVAACAPLLERAVTERVTPGAVLQVAGPEGHGAFVARGAAAYGGAAVGASTRYDLASVTKVTACLPSLLSLVQADEVALGDRVDRFFSNAGWMQEPSLGSVTVEDLALHRSGLPAWRPLFALTDDRRVAMANALQSSLTEPAGAHLYSDIGVIVLTAIVERVTGKRIDEYAQEIVFGPLGMTGAGYGPLTGAAPLDVAATEDDGLRGLLVGRVHDENADALGGVSGHAGLFATAADLTRYAQAWLRLEAPFAQADLLRAAVRDRSGGEGPRRGILWRCAEADWPFGPGPSESAYGHTGFTGTSVVIDPGRGCVVVLLTNRVHPRRGSAEGVMRLRRAVHAAVAEAFAEGGA